MIILFVHALIKPGREHNKTDRAHTTNTNARVFCLNKYSDFAKQLRLQDIRARYDCQFKSVADVGGVCAKSLYIKLLYKIFGVTRTLISAFENAHTNINYYAHKNNIHFKNIVILKLFHIRRHRIIRNYI